MKFDFLKPMRRQPAIGCTSGAVGSGLRGAAPTARTVCAPLVMKWGAGVILTGLLLGVSPAMNAMNYSYTPAPVDNPLKGFMPYAGVYTTFPYSMEWDYLPLRSLMTGPTNFNWSKLDSLLAQVAARGHQTVFRIYLDYPTLSTGIPQYLFDAGLATYSYDDYDNNGVSLCPDYSNALLDQALTNFVAALGARYDGDPRIGFVQLGLLGYWGEWHTYPETNWFASPAVQDEVMTAYAAAFHKTKMLIRWPAGDISPASLPFGYHDDSFANDTIDPPAYNFLGLLKAAGQTNQWLAQPVGGEVYPPIQSCAWAAAPNNCVPAGQEFTNCVGLTHASWMLNQAVFDPGFTGTEQSAALTGAHQLGYELYVTNASWNVGSAGDPLTVSLKLLNTGVAPFYYDWPVQLAVANTNHTVVQAWSTSWKLTTLVPGTNIVWTCMVTNPGLPVGQYKLLLGVMNPLTNGVPLQFANQTQDTDVTGWLTLGTFTVATVLPALSGRYLSPGFKLQLSNITPGTWTVEDSSNFITWTSLLTTNISTPQWTFIDGAASPARFYRAVDQP